MLSKGKEYKERLERLRAEDAQRRAAEHTHTPEIRGVKGISYDSGRRVEDRLMEVAARRKETQAQHEANKETPPVDPEATFTPKITAQAKKRHYEGVEKHLYYLWVLALVLSLDSIRSSTDCMSRFLITERAT